MLKALSITAGGSSKAAPLAPAAGGAGAADAAGATSLSAITSSSSGERSARPEKSSLIMIRTELTIRVARAAMITIGTTFGKYGFDGSTAVETMRASDGVEFGSMRDTASR